MLKTISFLKGFFGLVALLFSISLMGQTAAPSENMGSAKEHRALTLPPLGYKAPKVTYTQNWGAANAESSLKAYVYVNEGEPWSSPANPTHMDAVFGAGNWSAANYSSVNLTDLFSSATKVIWLEGGDGIASNCASFVTTNQTAIQNWVNAGGKLFLNAGTWSGVSITLGTTTLNGNQFSYTGTIAAGQGGHPIFNGPFLPVGTSWSGDYFSHNNVSSGGTTLVTGESGPIVTEKASGSGVMIFGGMTNTYFMPYGGDQTTSNNLFRNILSYLQTGGVCLPAPPNNQTVSNLLYNKATVSWSIPCNTPAVDNQIVEYARKNGTSWLPWVSVGVAGGTTSTILQPLAAGKTYRWRVRAHFPTGGVGIWLISNAPYPEFTTPTSFASGNDDGDQRPSGGITNLTAAPNPANGSTIVSMSFSDELLLEGTGLLRVQSLDGRLALEKRELPLAEMNAYELDLSNLRAGIYVLSVSTSEGVFAQKLVVQ